MSSHSSKRFFLLLKHNWAKAVWPSNPSLHFVFAHFFYSLNSLKSVFQKWKFAGQVIYTAGKKNFLNWKMNVNNSRELTLNSTQHRHIFCLHMGLKVQIMNPSGFLWSLCTCSSHTNCCFKEVMVTQENEQRFFCSSLVWKLSTKVKGLECAPALTEPFPTWSMLQTEWVFSIQPATHTDTQTCSVLLLCWKSVIYSPSSYFYGTFYIFIKFLYKY